MDAKQIDDFAGGPAASSSSKATNKSKKEKKSAKKTKLKPVEPEHLQAFKMARKAAIVNELKIDLEQEKMRMEKKKKKQKDQAAAEEETSCKVFKDNDYYKVLWDNSVLILAVINAFAVPVELTVFQDLSELDSYVVIDLIINIVFMIDVAICFNTSYFNIEGELVRTRKEIAMNYMFKGMFFIDFFSSIPYTLLGLSMLKFMKILKIFRITRLTKVIEKLEMEEDAKAFVKILKLIFMLFLIMHLLGCLWFYVVAIYQDQYEWAPPLDFIWVSRPEYYRFYDSDEVSPLYQYLVVLYTAVLALGGNEMGPRTNVEIVVMFGILVFLTMYNALIFGDMTVLVSEVTKKASNFQDQIDVANTAMKNMALPSEAQTKVRTYLITT